MTRKAAWIECKACLALIPRVASPCNSIRARMAKEATHKARVALHSTNETLHKANEAFHSQRKTLHKT